MDEKRQSFLFAFIVFLSGIAGLSYQLIWIRTIKGYFGSELFSMSLVVSIYFAGMGLGGVLGSRLLKRGFGAMRLYAIIEAALALFGLIFPFLIGSTHELYLLLIQSLPAPVWMLIKVLLIGLLLIVPTTLIGITLPLIAAAVVSRPEVFTSRFSRFYGLNTFGAVFGCLLTGFVLIPQAGFDWTGRIIALTNAVAAVLLYLTSRIGQETPLETVYKKQSWRDAFFPGSVAFLMGFLALNYEVVWIRIFGFYFISSTASLALLLSIFLVGLALGSWLLSFWKKPVSIRQLAILELIKIGTMVGAFLLVRIIFYSGWQSVSMSLTQDVTFSNLVRYYSLFGLIVFFIPGLVMGMTFPLIERIWPASRAGSGHVVGVVAAWNTWGGTMGAAGAGLLFIVLLGSSNTLIVSIFLSSLIAFMLFSRIKAWIPAGLALLLFVLTALFLPREMNYSRKPENLASYDYYKEGRGSSVSILRNQFNEKLLYLSNTYILGGTSHKGQLIQKRQGAMPVILNTKQAKTGLKVGLGTGVSLSGLADSKQMAQVDGVEIVPEVIELLPRFTAENGGVQDWKNVSIHGGDGREFLSVSQKNYDVILGELYTPQFAGAGNLYSVHHLKNIRSHLNEGGVFCQWLQLSQFTQETFRIVIRTFLEVFGGGSLWIANTDVEKPIVGLIYSERPFWSQEDLATGLNMYNAEGLDFMGWTTPEDIAAHFITDNLWSLLGEEDRVNTLSHPWIEEISPRSFPDPGESPVSWFLKSRRWPEAWQSWESGRKCWSAYGLSQLAMLQLKYNKSVGARAVLRMEQMLERLPEIPSLNLYKAEILVTMVQNVYLRSKVFKEAKTQQEHMIKLVEKAVSMAPGDYTYRNNLWRLYMATGQSEKAMAAFKEMQAILPEEQKSAPAFRTVNQ